MFRMITRWICAAVAVAAMAEAPSAAAAVMTATYSGVVLRGQDQLSAFGLSDLGGLSFVATFAYDTDIGERFTTSGEDLLRGGAFVSEPSPFLSATIRINGHTQSIVGGAVDLTYIVPNQALSQTFSTLDQTLPQANYLSMFVDTSGAIPDLARDQTLLSAPGQASPSGIFRIAAFDTGLGAYRVASGDLQTTKVVFAGGVVPEPAAWALMLVGFAAAGVALRRRGLAAAARG